VGAAEGKLVLVMGGGVGAVQGDRYQTKGNREAVFEEIKSGGPREIAVFRK